MNFQSWDWTLNGPAGWTLDDKISRSLENRRAGGVNGADVNIDDTWVVAEFFPDVDMQEARRLAEAAGFRVQEHPDLIETHLLLSGSSSRLSGLAQWDEVAYIFPASRDLIRGEQVAHCAGALTAGGTTPMYVTAGSGWPKDAIGQVTLSYVFGNITPKLDSAQANQETPARTECLDAIRADQVYTGTVREWDENRLHRVRHQGSRRRVPVRRTRRHPGSHLLSGASQRGVDGRRYASGRRRRLAHRRQYRSLLGRGARDRARPGSGTRRIIRQRSCIPITAWERKSPRTTLRGYRVCMGCREEVQRLLPRLLHWRSPLPRLRRTQ